MKTDILRNNKTLVISHLIAAEIWGFLTTFNNKYEFYAPKGYNNNNRYIKEYNSKIHYKNRDELDKFSEILYIEDDYVKICNKEKTIIDVIKILNNEYNDQYLQMIENFFIDYDYDKIKLYEYANKEKNIRYYYIIWGDIWINFNIEII